jgi:hypothetical protein
MTNQMATSPYVDARCIDCGYALRELNEHRCPECGRTFDPQNPFSMNTPLYRQRLRTASWVPALLFATTFIALFVLPRIAWPLRGFSQWGDAGTVGYIVASLVVGWMLRTRARRAILGNIADPNRRSDRWGRRAIAITALICFVVAGGGAGSWECPHGQSFRVGLLVITRDSEYGPCGNYGYVRWKQRLAADIYVSIIEP